MISKLKQTSNHGIWKPAVLTLALLLTFSVRDVHGDVRLAVDERIPGFARLNEPLNVDTLISVALIASGVAESDMERWTGRVLGVVAQAPPRRGDLESDAEILLQWMHEELLVRYVEEQTRIDVMMENGTYNCVSSAVLFMILARSRGIGVHGVLTTDHAFCRVLDPEIEVGFDVETTTPYGFDPGRRMEAVDAFTGRTGFRYVPPGNYRARRDIGERELIALIYQNRMAALQRSGRWEDTVGLARDRWALTGTAEARADFRTSITNYAAGMDRSRRQEEALLVLKDAAGILGTDHDLAGAASALLGNAVAYHLRADDPAAALELLNNPDYTALVPDEFLESRRQSAVGKSLEITVKNRPFGEAVPAVDEAFDEGAIDVARWSEMTLFLWSEEARRLSSGGNWLEGWMLLQTAPVRTTGIRRWSELDQTYYHNAVIDFHNRFTSAQRGGRIDEARSILDRGLNLFPDAPILNDDLRRLEESSR